MRKIILSLLILIIVLFGIILFVKNPKEEKVFDKKADNKFTKRVSAVKKLVASDSKYSNKTAFFIDMKISSGKNRFFVYDLQNNRVIDKGLVAHGSGSETKVEGELKFSNVNNSLSTSLGKYYIGYSYNGDFGKAYKLHGLDKTNDNAFLRNIVLHKYSKVPYEEQDTPICNSYGCPMVNERFYKRIEKLIDASDKKIVLDIYY
ncbi:murein L,D-transpeptidase catalytic domain family protein [Flavobacterium sp. Fl-318]|uniref:Murein L,D-transpeptidase catalytic domain family protein n=1 Tax=Flavobacterium cupriresistens TaxID=2893885 RepID=A0ABU4RAB4_9FLAO|nr:MULTISPECIES: murein L,D-transpeptidase catalytic domain family protein [unclassified Flavobacterium]MDX6188400.1 murein L,D-transpeptidase catalytic domain family protein [Flavobacterium sp. Fl-318]UFH44929.1 murein L,D-transpeptidase catalytic domain family protein [Flavobacterium sp. F-323]